MPNVKTLFPDEGRRRILLDVCLNQRVKGKNITKRYKIYYSQG